MRVGYVPYSRDLTQPGDRRRFPYYAAARGIDFELAQPDDAYDVVVVTPRTDLDLWARRRRGETKLVFDIVDSYLDIPRRNVKQLLRGPAKFAAGEAGTPFFSYGRALERILARADAVTCATPEQAAAIAPFCPNVHPILDFQTRMITAIKEDYAAGTPVNLVWEGLGENARWFSEISGALAQVAASSPLVLHLITAPRFKQISQRFWTRDTAALVRRHFGEVQVHQWTEDSVAQIATRFDVAVIPLPLDRPLERGKPESKLASFWRMGLPVVASATPAYERVMAAAGERYACAGEADWVAALCQLIADDSERARSARAGRAYAEATYGDERLAAAWDAVFTSF